MAADVIAFRTLISAHLKAYRKKYRLSQESMAELLHISPRSYSDLESKKSMCSGSTLMYYQAALSRDEILELWDAIRETVPESLEIHRLVGNPTKRKSYL